MIAVTDQFIQKQLKEVIECVNIDGKTKLVSLVKKVKPIDPLIFYRNGTKEFSHQRFFWQDPDRTFSLVGLGYTHIISTERHQDRFHYIEKEWKRFIDRDVICMGDIPSGTGPLLFGGFSFDPKQDKDTRWNEFSSGKFVVPAYLYTVKGGEAFFTANLLIHPTDETQKYNHFFEEKEKQLFQLNGTPRVQEELSHIISKHEVEPDLFKQSVQEATNRIKREQIEKVVLARQLDLFFNEPLKKDVILERLTKEQPTSYVYTFDSKGYSFIGASPERLIKRSENNVFSTCLAGSIRRGYTLREDEELGQQLLADEKNLIEHDVVVHMIKEAMIENCTDIQLPKGPSLYKTKHIQHLYTPVKGVIRDGVTLFSFLEKLHPTPALGGFPQKKALEVIRELENFERGWYAAPIGWMDMKGNGEFIVGIRSGLLSEQEATLFAGCGIVADSDPESEYEETKIKFNPMLSALGGVDHVTH
ncbi:isochorismate synthase [Metabacillus iocasae]|uniref:Isochorismate synthase MenF n=1 Tax=Priestia iocasae TaxID=2291674 RepID=A0ABS2R242_9BACI|nr:menaquinone-specific isochorismate synthase [Metabacillus iocasae]